MSATPARAAVGAGVVVAVLTALAPPLSPATADSAGQAPAPTATAAAPAAATTSARSVRVIDVRLDAHGVGTVLADRTAAQGATSTIGPDQHTVPVDVRLASGRVLHTSGITTDIRAEFPAVPGSSVLSPTRVRPARPVVELRLPTSVRTRTITLRHGGRAFRTHGLAPHAPARRSARADGDLTPIPGYDVGPRSNRLDIVVLGDGFTADQRSLFTTKATEAVDAIMSTAPYLSYRDFVNVTGIFKASAQAGADHPVCGGQGAGTTVTTRYESTYCSSGIERLLVPTDMNTVYADAAEYGDYDQILMVVNDQEYGGSGGAIATTSLNAQGTGVMTHELGHSLMRLADEYTDAAPYPPCSDRGRDGVTAPCASNITDISGAGDRSTLKWNRWVSPATALPTPAGANASVVGAFLGGYYAPDTYYRPCDACLMRYLGTPMGAVESEQLPLRMFRTTAAGGFGMGLIDPGSASPSTTTDVGLAPGAQQTFRARVLSVADRAGTTYTWAVDGVAAATGTTGTATRTFPLDGDGAAHTVTLTVQALPGVLHPDDVGLTRTSVSWHVEPQDGPAEPSEALRNGGFEAALSPAWSPSAGVARVCNARARHGRCAVRVTAHAGTSRLLGQWLDPARFGTGDRVDLSAALDSMGLTKGAVLTLSLTGESGRQTTVRLRWAGGDARDRARYARRAGSATVPGTVTAARLTMTAPPGRGKALLDDLSVLVTPTGRGG